MPSGAKKRKAARRKKEMGVHPPDSPTNPYRGDGESQDSKGESSDEGEEKKGESPRSESITVPAMDNSENGQEKLSEDAAKALENPPVEEKKKEKVVEEETVAMPVVREAEDVSVELAQSEKVEVDGAEATTEVAEEKSATVASVVHVDEPVSVTKEVIEATEAAAVTSEASLVIDALAHQSEVKPAPFFDTPPAPVIEQPQPRESGELCDRSERSEAVPGPLVERRATWWNCCGLFDVFMGSRVAT